MDGAARSTHTWTSEAGVNHERSNFAACSVTPLRWAKMVIMSMADG
jgi:hypothetical protein